MYSSVISLSTIFVVLITMGVPSGVQRFLGKSFAEGKLEDVRVQTTSSVLLVSIGILLSLSTIIIARDWMSEVFRMDYILLFLLVVLVVSDSIRTLLRAIVISSLKTKGLTRIAIISTGVRFSIAACLVLFGAVSLGIALSFAIFSILTSILLAINVVELFKYTKGYVKSNTQGRTPFRQSLKNILVAGMAAWIPNSIYIVGSQLGIIVVNSSQGANAAGLYFISYSIVAAILTVPTVLQTITYPVLSGMHDGRKRFSWRMLKLTLIVIMPLSSSIIFYSKDIVQVFGQQYIQSSSTLEIMVLSILPTAVAGSISILVYSYGNYRMVLVMGLSLSIPRVALYFILVPLYGGNGGAISFVLGSLGGLLAAIIIGRKIKMRFFWRVLTLLFIIPTALAFVFNYIGINYIFGIILTNIVSYPLFLRFRILDKTDLVDAVAILPQKIRNPRLVNLLTLLAKKINPYF